MTFRPPQLASPIIASTLLLLFLSAFPSSPHASPQVDLEKPLQNIDEDISAFAFAPDGRIVFSIRRHFHTKEYDLERDDIWLQENGGKRRRLLQGEKFIRGNTPSSYTVDSFRWSPNSRFITAELFITSIDDAGKPQDSTSTVVLEDNGKEIRVGLNDNVLEGASDATWLLDNATIVFFTEVVKPKILFSMRYKSITGGPAGNVFEGRTFLDAVPLAHSNFAIAIEQDRNQAGPPRLQRLELLAQDDHELATLDSYQGGLSLSPTGKRAAYFLDKEILEIRDLAAPDHFARLRVGYGSYQWSPDESRILLKRAPERKSGDLVWLEVPPLAAHSGPDSPPVIQPTPLPILHALTFRDFAISPDGKFLAVIAPGKRNLLVFPLPL